MGQITKEFAEHLLKRLEAGHHINTTCGEEQQLVHGWLYWYENFYAPRMAKLVAQQTGPIESGPGAGMAGGQL